MKEIAEKDSVSDSVSVSCISELEWLRRSPGFGITVGTLDIPEATKGWKTMHKMNTK
jgi:hypothetical protein